MAGKAQNPGHFLVGIAGLIRNSEGDYLLMKRGAARDFGAESWECVTGRSIREKALSRPYIDGCRQLQQRGF